MSIVTDSKGVEEPKDPDTCNVFALYRLFATEEQQQAMRERYTAGGLGYGQVKKELFELFWESFAPYRAKREELAADPGAVMGILKEGAEKARAEAAKTLDRARKAMGLISAL